MRIELYSNDPGFGTWKMLIDVNDGDCQRESLAHWWGGGLKEERCGCREGGRLLMGSVENEVGGAAKECRMLLKRA